jgi:hypothetical protein
MTLRLSIAREYIECNFPPQALEVATFRLCARMRRNWQAQTKVYATSLVPDGSQEKLAGTD